MKAMHFAAWAAWFDDDDSNKVEYGSQQVKVSYFIFLMSFVHTECYWATGRTSLTDTLSTAPMSFCLPSLSVKCCLYIVIINIFVV